MSKQTMSIKNVRDDLAPEIWSLAGQAGLGELRGVYYASQSETRAQLFSAILLLLGVIIALPSILAVLFSPIRPSPWFALPGLTLVVAGVCLLLPRKIYTRWHVYLWEAGFLYEKGPLRQAFRWDQIESIQGQASYVPQMGSTLFIYKVRRQDGCEVKLTNVFQNCSQLIDIVLEECSRQMAARELNIVPPRDSVLVDFKLDRQGISDKQVAFSWREIQELTIEKGTMAVLKRDGLEPENLL